MMVPVYCSSFAGVDLSLLSTNQIKSFPALAQSLPLRTRTLSFRATSCHSERSEESPPFAKRKGARGMPTRHSRGRRGPEWMERDESTLRIHTLSFRAASVIPSGARNLPP